MPIRWDHSLGRTAVEMPKDLAIPMAFPDCRARSDEINSDVPSGHAKAASESVSRDPVIVGFRPEDPALPG